RVVDRQRQAGPGHVRAVRRGRAGGPRGAAPRDPQAPNEVQDRSARDGGRLMATGFTAAVLRSSSPEELSSKLAEAKEELFNLRFQSATGQLESHGRLRAVRKEIARIYTVLRERELGIIIDVEDENATDVEGSAK